MNSKRKPSKLDLEKALIRNLRKRKIHQRKNQKNDSKYYKIYKDFFIKNIKRNKIKKAYLVKPLWGGNEVFENGLNSDCYKKEKITEILDVYTLKECKELK